MYFYFETFFLLRIINTNNKSKFSVRETLYDKSFLFDYKSFMIVESTNKDSIYVVGLSIVIYH